MILTAEMAPAQGLDLRRLEVSSNPRVVGLSHVDAARLPDGHWELTVFFIPSSVAGKPAVPPGLTRANVLLFRIDGSPADLRIESLAAPARPEEPLHLRVWRERRAQGDDLYILRLTGVPDVDPLFAQVRFALSGQPVPAPAAPPLPDLALSYAPIDYLSKDYQSFRQLMLERMTLTFPQWRERNAADLGITIVEVLAYAADFLSYYQDAVGTEAYLGTARRRISVRRHARLLDYTLHDGLNSRVWAQVQVTGGPPVRLPRGTGLLTRTQSLGPVVAPEQLAMSGAQTWISRYFETLEAAELHPEQNRMELYDWGMPDYVLPCGATSATLAGRLPSLRAGDVLILQALGAHMESSPPHTHPVRLRGRPLLTLDPLRGREVTEIAWYEEDALPFPLPVSIQRRGETVPCAVARGNIVPADQGQTFQQELPPVPPEGRYRALLPAGIAVRAPFDPALARRRPAAVALEQNVDEALPAVTLLGQRGEISGASQGLRAEVWVPRRDLLTSGPYGREFVVEIENDGSASLRFGDGQLGMKPAAYTRFKARFRLGGGPTGNVGAYSICHLVTADPALPARIRKVTNYTEGQGGTAPESSRQAALRAPRSFQRQERCVTREDFTARAKSYRDGEVLDAVAEPRWTGSWTTLFLYVERRGGLPVDPGFTALFRAYMEPFLLADQELAVRPPFYLPLEIVLAVTLARNAFPEVVRQELERLLGTGPGGFFAPGNFLFGQPVYLSEIITRAAGAAGVARVDARRFQRWGEPSRGELAAGRIAPGPLEIARVENRPGAPQLGVIRFELEGGA